MKSPAEDLPHRRPVWEALSDLYLDTDASLSRPGRVKVLAASPYSMGDMEKILATEVHPACCFNQLQIAGEWAGFDMVWLEQRILKRQRSLMRWLTWYWLFNLGSWEWRKTKAEIVNMRKQNSPSQN